MVSWNRMQGMNRMNLEQTSSYMNYYYDIVRHYSCNYLHKTMITYCTSFCYCFVIVHVITVVDTYMYPFCQFHIAQNFTIVYHHCSIVC